MAVCPHCKGDISMNSLVRETKGIGVRKQETMYSCPHCDCVLGFGVGKYT